MRIDYYAYISGMNHWNPAFKVLIGFLTLVLCVCSQSMIVSLFVLFTMSGLTICVGKMKIKTYFGFLKIPLAFLIIGALTIAIEFSKSPISDANRKLFGIYVMVSMDSVFRAACVSLKALGAVSALYMVSLSTGLAEIVVVLQKLHVPPLIIELMHLIYRYIFVMLDLFEDMSNAAASRLGYVDYKTSLKTFGQILGNLFVVSLKKANTCYDAMLARGYDGTLSFWQEEKPLDKKLVFAGTIYILILLFLTIFTTV